MRHDTQADKRQFSAFRRAVREASVDHTRWPETLRILDGLLADSRPELVGWPLHRDMETVRFTVDGVETTTRGAAPDRRVQARDRAGDASLRANGPGRRAAHELFLLANSSRVWRLALRGRADAPLDLAEVQRLGSGIPLLSAACRVSSDLAEGTLPSLWNRNVTWDRSLVAYAICSPELRILAANPAAEALLAARAVFRPAGRNGRLRPLDELCEERLELAAARIVAGGRRRELVHARARRGGGHVVLTLLPLALSPFAAASRGPRDGRILLSLEEIGALNRERTARPQT